MKFFITGSSGFIGFHLSKKLLDKGHNVHGFDSMNNYYDVKLKKVRLKILKQYKNFSFTRGLLENQKILAKSILKFKPKIIIHLAAQAGVRYSIEKPRVYLDSNIIGTYNIIELSKKIDVKHLLIASSSSVYGANKKLPFREIDKTETQLSIYASTKKATESIAHSFSSVWKIPTTILRFFTVYGPWGRPDMALFKFTEAIAAGSKIEVFNYGKHRRDFTYIDDIVEGVTRVLDSPAQENVNWDGDKPDPGTSKAPWRVYNIGNNSPVELLDYISAIEEELGILAKKELLPLQPGDVPDTFADVSDLVNDFNFKPKTNLKKGVKNFIDWYKEFYQINV